MSWGLTADQAPRASEKLPAQTAASLPCVPADWPRGHRGIQEAPTALHQRGCSSREKTQGRDGEKLESKQCWLMLKVKRWPAILPTSIHLVHERPCNFRVMGFPMPHCVSITKPHKLCGFSAPSAYWSHARKYFPGQRDHFVDSCCRWGRRDSLRTFNERPPAVPLVEHANRSHLLQIKAIKNSKRNLSVWEVCVFCANIVRQFSLFC